MRAEQYTQRFSGATSPKELMTNVVGGVGAQCGGGGARRTPEQLKGERD